MKTFYEQHNGARDAAEPGELADVPHLWQLQGPQYGELEGSYIVVSGDNEEELSGPMSEAEANELIRRIREPMTKFAAFKMHPVAACDVWGERIPLEELNNVSEPKTTTVTEYEEVAPDSPHIAHWSVYGCAQDGTLEHLADCPNRAAAELILGALRGTVQ